MRDFPIARVKNLRVTYRTRSGPVEAVKDLTFEVARGETLCIVGESGSGKSAGALAVMRLIDYGGGCIEEGLIEIDVGDDRPLNVGAARQPVMRQMRGHKIGMVFQEPMTALNPVLTVGRQLTEGLRLHKKLDVRHARQQALNLLKEVRIPEPERRYRQYPHELSGGMRQRVVIAMALACGPRLLIADEPTTALDVTTQAEILALIDRLKRDHDMAVILITHDMAVVAQMADKVVVVRDGEQVEDGTVKEIFHSPKHSYTRELLSAVPRLGSMRGEAHPRAIPVAGGASPIPVKGGQGVLLEVDSLTTRFPIKGGLLRRTVAQVHAVEDVSFKLGRGRTLALVGESGCGKSTTGRSILRLVEPDSGRILLDGRDLCKLTPPELRRARMDMQMIFQDPYGSLNPQRRLYDQVAEPFWNYNVIPQTDIENRVKQLFDCVGLPQSYLQRFPHELSGGQRQRVAIARALALEPKLIVADEALSALDVSVQARVLNLMMELQAEFGLSYLFISHDMAVVERISHDVAVMYQGRIVEQGPRAAVFENPQHPYTKSLLSAVPIADPDHRLLDQTRANPPVPSPIHPIDYSPERSVYQNVGADHVVLTSPQWG